MRGTREGHDLPDSACRSPRCGRYLGLRNHVPHLAGFVTTVDEAAGARTAQFALPGAACHAVFARLADSTVQDLTGWAEGFVFRNEPSRDPMRLVVFRQTEVVVIGNPERVRAEIDTAFMRCMAMLTTWGIEADSVIASDSFAGRRGTLRSELQLDAETKRELVFDMWEQLEGNRGSALSSANLHQARFGTQFAIHLPDGSMAHSGCVGLGLERTAMALCRRHGAAIGQWPTDIRAELNLPEPSNDSVRRHT